MNSGLTIIVSGSGPVLVDDDEATAACVPPTVEAIALFRRLACFRPARLVAKYSHVLPRFSQRAHVGLSLLHLSLDAEQL